MSHLSKDDLEYIAYTDSFGDSTPPLSFDEFVKYKNGTGSESNGPRKVLTRLEQEYASYAGSGDGTVESYEEWLNNKFGKKPEPTPRKKLTKEDAEYIAYTDSFGDSTPELSFQEWKDAGKPSN